MNLTATWRPDSAVRILVTALLALVAVVASVLVAPPARADETSTDATEMLEVSADQSTWAPGPSAAVLAWSEPFADMSPGDTSTQQYYVRNVGSASVRLDIAGFVPSLADYSYLAVESTVDKVSGTVTRETSARTFYLVGNGAADVDGLAVAPTMSDDTLVAGALLAPGSTARVTNTVSLPSEVDRLPAEVKQRFMYQDTQAHFTPRASLDDRVATIAINQSGGTPAVVGSPVEFTIRGEPADLVVGGTFVVADAGGREIAELPVGEDGTARFTHTFRSAGDQSLIVRFEPGEGQVAIAPVTVVTNVAKSPGGSGSSGGSLGSLGWLFAVPAVIAVVAAVVGGIWFLAHEARVPGVPHFPGAPPRPFAAQPADQGPLAALAGWFRPPAASSGPTVGEHAGSLGEHAGSGQAGGVATTVAGSVDQQHLALPALPDQRSWWTRMIDTVQGFFG